MSRGFSIQNPPFFIEDYILERPFSMNQDIRRPVHLLLQPAPNEDIHNAAYDRLIEEMTDKDSHSEFVDECISELKDRDARRRAIGLKPMSDIWAELSAHEMWAVNILMQQMDAPPKKRSFINAYRKRSNSRKNRK